MKDGEGSFRVNGNPKGRFTGKGFDGVFKLRRFAALPGFDCFGWNGQRGGDTSNDANDENSEQFLLDTIDGFAVKAFDLETDFFVAVRVLDSPTTIIQIDNALAGKGLFVEQMGKQHRQGAVGMS
ncbi:MAG: hypothetical protein QX199_14440 [Methylococcaceae bacterium]